MIYVATYFSLQIRLQSFKSFCCLFCSWMWQRWCSLAAEKWQLFTECGRNHLQDKLGAAAKAAADKKRSWVLHYCTCSSSTTSATAAGPAPKIERILKIENKETAIHEFEEYRNKVKERNAPATAAAHDHHYSSYNNSSSRDHLAGMNMIGKSRKKKTVPVILLQQQGGGGSGAAADQRCVADGNELLRFFATSLSCCLGDNGCTNLCSLPDCNVCSIIRWGFVNQRGEGIYTTATSGRPHQDFISKPRIYNSWNSKTNNMNNNNNNHHRYNRRIWSRREIFFPLI